MMTSFQVGSRQLQDAILSAPSERAICFRLDFYYCMRHEIMEDE